MRVIAGLYRGRKLASPPDGSATVRPTADRVKESLFNILNPRMDGATVLDLFTGSGALAVESISRGAIHAVCCDRQTALVRTNVQALGLTDKAEILSGDYTVCIERLRERHFDIVFLDPPYASDYTAVMKAAQALDADLFVVEHDTRDSFEAEGYIQTDERRYGNTTVTFFTKGERL